MIINKYQGNGGGGGSYTLPVASQSTLGGVKVGEGLSIDSGGTLAVSGGTYELPAASQSTLGGVKVGEGLTIDSGGTLSVSGGSSAGGDYVIVDSLSEITSPTEGMIAFVPEHQETYSGLSMDGGQLAYQAKVMKYAPREIEYEFSDSHNFNTNNPNSAPFDFQSEFGDNTWGSIWDDTVWLKYDETNDKTYCVTKPGFSVICYLSSESYEEITTAVTISPKTYIYRNSNWLRYEDGLISFRLDTIATMAEWTAFIANAKAFAPGDFQFVVDYYNYGWNTYKFKTRDGYVLDDFHGYTFVCKASNGESTDEASALSLRVSNGSDWKDYGIAKYDLRPTWSQIVTAGTQIASVTINGETTNVYVPEAAGGGGGDYVVVDSLSEITSPTEGMIAFVRAGQKTLSGYTFDMSVVGDHSVKLKINNPTERSWQVHKRWDEGWMTSTSGRKTDMWLRFGTDGVVRSFYMESIAGCYSNYMYTLVVDPDIWTWQISTSSENYTETAVTFNTPDREYIYVNNSWQHYENGKITFYLNTLNSNEYDAVSAITQQYPPEEIQLAADYRQGINSPIKYYTFPISNGALNDRITTEAVFESTPQSETIPNVDAMAAFMMFGGYREWGFLIQSVMNTNVFIDFQESGSTLTSSQGDDIRLQLNSQVSNNNTWARIVPRIKNEDGSKYISIGSDLLFWLYDSSHDFRTKYFRFAFRYIDASGDTYDTKWSYANGTLTCDSKTLVS